MSNWPIKVMVYGAGEAIDGGGALAPQIRKQLDDLARVATNFHVAATAQLDSTTLPTLRFVLDPSGRQPVAQLPEVNTGDPEELISYAQWASALCPADRNVLVLSGHGAAWEDSYFELVLGVSSQTRNPRGVSRVPGAIHNARKVFGDELSKLESFTRFVLVDGSHRDYLSNAELGEACRRIAASLPGGTIDVLVLDACLMSSWELLHELAGSVRCVVASIDELSAAGVDLAGPAKEMTALSGALDARAIATTIARGFHPTAHFDSCVAIDLGSSSWGQAVSLFQQCCAILGPWVREDARNAAALGEALRYAATSLVKFTAGGLSDLASFADALDNSPVVPRPAAELMRSVQRSLEACVLARSTGADYRNALGISLFTPNSITAYETNRSDYARLGLPRMTGWGSILDAVYGGLATRLPVADDRDAVEFVVSLRGFPISDAIVARIEKAIRRVVLEHLARMDILSDVSVLPVDRFLQTRARVAPEGTTAGMVIQPNVESGRISSAGVLNVATTTTPDGKEFRVVLRGLQVDAATVAAIDVAIRAAVLAEVASLDLADKIAVDDPQGDPTTRSLLDRVVGQIRGLMIRV